MIRVANLKWSQKSISCPTVAVYVHDILIKKYFMERGKPEEDCLVFFNLPLSVEIRNIDKVAKN